MGSVPPSRPPNRPAARPQARSGAARFIGAPARTAAPRLACRRHLVARPRRRRRPCRTPPRTPPAAAAWACGRMGGCRSSKTMLATAPPPAWWHSPTRSGWWERRPATRRPRIPTTLCLTPSASSACASQVIGRQQAGKQQPRAGGRAALMALLSLRPQCRHPEVAPHCPHHRRMQHSHPSSPAPGLTSALPLACPCHTPGPCAALSVLQTLL